MRSLVYLHVGTHKTGSTAIQACLATQQDDFRRAGIEPWLENAQGNASRLAHGFVRPQLSTPMRLIYPAVERLAWANSFAGAFRRHVEASEADIHLISSESFCFLRTNRERQALTAFLGGMFHEVRPVLILRNRADWKASWNGQIRKMKLDDQISTLPASERVTAEWYFDAPAIREFWGGVGRVAEIDYDKAIRDDGSVLPAFLQAIGQPDLRLAQPYFENVSPQKNSPPDEINS